MRTITFLVIFLFFGISTQSQDLTKSKRESPFTYVYKISNKQAFKIYRKKKIDADSSLFRYLVDSFPSNKIDLERLHRGHYLLVNAHENRLNLSVHSVDRMNPIVINNNNDFCMMVTDEKGFVDDAIVRVGGRKIRFDSKTHTYRLPKSHPDGYMTIEKDGYEGIYIINKLYKTNRVGQALAQKPIRYIWNPVRLVVGSPIDLYSSFRRGYPVGVFYYLWKPFRDVVRSIDYGHAVGWVEFVRDFTESVTYGDPEPRVEKLWCFFNHGFRDKKGFIVLNKPIYKPADTVKFKAFVADVKGQLKNEKLNLYIDNKKIKEIVPYKKGFYEDSFCLHDSLSLRLDRPHTVYLKNKNGRLVYERFGMEDYELKNNSFSARLEKREHYRGEMNAIICTGKDENGNPIPDAKVEITVLKGYVTRAISPEVFIPDTLWKSARLLDDMSETIIPIPDSIFPAAILNYNVKVEMKDPSNEFHRFDESGFFNGNKTRVKVDAQGTDSLVAKLYYCGKEVNGSGSLKIDEQSLFNIQFPFAFEPNPVFRNYRFEEKGVMMDYSVPDDLSNIQITSERISDSIKIAIKNPRNLKIDFFIYKSNNEIFRGVTSSDNNFGIKYKSKKNCSLFVSYVWGGRVIERNYNLTLDNYINLNILSPQNIVPGQEVELKYALTDSKGKSIADADVTAWAVTSKFKNQQEVYLPDFSKESKPRMLRNSFSIRTPNDIEVKKELNYSIWRKKLRIDTIEFYKFLYPKDGFYNKSFRANNYITSISPFIHSNGKPLRVQQININGWPAYFGLENNSKPYVFRASEKNKIEFITNDKIYRLKDVKVQPNLKTIINIDISKDIESLSVVRKRRRHIKQQVKDANRYILRIRADRNIFGVKGYISQNSSVFFIPSLGYYNKNLNIAPVFLNDFAFTTLNNEYQLSFEQGCKYSFGSNVVKVTRAEPFVKTDIKRASKLLEWKFSDSILTNHDALEYLKPKPDKFSRFFSNANNVYNLNSSGTKIHFSYKASTRPIALVLLSYTDSYFIICERVTSKNRLDFSLLKSGLYRAILFYDNFIVERDSIRIPSKGELYLEINENCLGDKQFKYLNYGELSSKIGGFPSSTYDFARKLFEGSSLHTVLDKPIVKQYSESKKVYNLGNVISGIVTSSEDGMPIPGVSVVIKGTSVGAVTDIDGRYELYLSRDAQTIVFSSVGFKQQEIQIENSSTIDVMLDSESLMVDEIVVTAFGVKRSAGLSGKIAGVQVTKSPEQIRIRGSVTLSSGSTPLYVVDGVIMTESEMKQIDQSQVESISVLKGEQATGLYGARGSNGVVVIKTRGNKKSIDIAAALTDSSYAAGLEGASALRTNFSDYAFWHPKLKTDKNGIAKVKVKFPDDITTWRNNAIAVSGDLRLVKSQNLIKSFKPIMASLSLPRFMVQGDSVYIKGRVRNYAEKEERVKRFFKLFGKDNMLPDSMLNKVINDSILVVAPKEDSLSVEYSVNSISGNKDGERRKIPLNPIGTVETKGLFVFADVDTTFIISDSIIGKGAKIYASSGRYDFFESYTESIIGYPYLCNEQASSKLFALLTLEKAAKLDDKPFKQKRDVKRLIKKLLESRGKDGLWGWWKDGEDQTWISVHVVRALIMAKSADYQVDLNMTTILDLLKKRMEELKSFYDLVATLDLLLDIDKTTDYKMWIEKLEVKNNSFKYKSLLDAINISSIKMRAGIIKHVPDSLFKFSKPAFAGGACWGDETIFPYEHRNVLTAEMYKLIKLDSTKHDWLKRINKFFFVSVNNNSPMNTYHKTLVLDAIGDDLFASRRNEKPLLEMKINDSLVSISKFPFEGKLKSGDKVTISKKGGRPVLFTSYSRVFNPNPLKVSDHFEVSTHFENNPKKVKAGVPIVLKAIVTVKKDSPYTMVEVPIPAGFSYDDKQKQEYREDYREKYKDHVSVFYSRLREGVYEIDIKLIPRFTGRFTLNPARAELMYFPTFYGRESVKKVRVE